jgi:hypothetical protein
MYGIMGTALVLGILGIQLNKKKKVRSFHGDPIVFVPKDRGFSRYMYGGIIFGLGWALAGACPGPMFVLLGAGFLPILVVILFAIFGTFVYGLLRDRLPH